VGRKRLPSPQDGSRALPRAGFKSRDALAQRRGRPMRGDRTGGGSGGATGSFALKARRVLMRGESAHL
jgi:hypothetical protein